MSGGKLKSLQVLRGLAAMLVVWHHAYTHLRVPPGVLAPPHMRMAGGFGVDIFFVLSGFIIARTAIFEHRAAAGDFIWRRVMRVAPMFWIMSLPWIALALMKARYLPGQTLDLRQIVATITFWPVYDQLVKPLLGIGWTLCYEILFYGCMAALLTRETIGYRWLWPMSAFGLIAASRLVADMPLNRFLGNLVILEFLGGVALARLHQPSGVPRRWAGAAALLTGLALWLSYTWLTGALGLQIDAWEAVGDVNRVVVFGPAAVLVVYGALQFEDRIGGWLGRRLVQLGDASYSIYLSHGIAMFGVMYPIAWVMHFDGDMTMVGGIVLAALFGLVVYRWIERPVLSLFARRPPQPVMAS